MAKHYAPRKRTTQGGGVAIAAILGGVVLILGLIAAVVGLEVADRDPENVIYLITAVLIPTGVAAFNTYLTTKQSKKIDQVESNTDDSAAALIHENKELRDQLEEQRSLVGLTDHDKSRGES